MLTVNKTGRTRLRAEKRWRKESLLVLQVELRVTGFEMDSNGMSRDRDYTIWRDAKVEDVPMPPPILS